MDEDVVNSVIVAHRWAEEHVAVDSVSHVKNNGDDSCCFTVIFRVPIPTRYTHKGVTRLGVRCLEPVTLLFPPTFPFQAPTLRLRDDFCREFPHINPSKKHVSPCVYDGNLAELLQQPRWFDGILDQIADWLSKAAANNLMNLGQGWEPMRTDEWHGFLIDDWEGRQEAFETNPRVIPYSAAFLMGCDGHYSAFVLSSDLDKTTLKKQGNSAGLILPTPPGHKSDRYIPRYVADLKGLEDLGDVLGVEGLREHIANLRRRLTVLGKRVLFVTLAVQRPVHLIGSPYRTEFLSFAVSWTVRTKKGRTKTKYMVEALSNLHRCTPALLRRFSGLERPRADVCLVGCGSLGSKIGLHLARAGQERFSLVDNDILLPHNNSRHGLVVSTFSRKSVELASALRKMGAAATQYTADIRENLDAITATAVVVDSTASLSVRNMLAQSSPGSSIVHCSMYDSGRLGLLCIEGPNHNPRSDDLTLCHLYDASGDPRLRKQMFENLTARRSIGQGCGSFTVIAPDSRISLHAGGMAARIRKHTELPESRGEILVGKVDEWDMGIVWDRAAHDETVVIRNAFGEDWDVRVLGRVADVMGRRSQERQLVETGGALIGHVSYSNRCMTVVDILPPPPDSIESPTLFVLGTEGLKRAIESIERKANGVFTYLGTWHSHPHGGRQSNTDAETLEKIIFLREYEPTVCLIWMPTGIGVVKVKANRAPGAVA